MRMKKTLIVIGILIVFGGFLTWKFLKQGQHECALCVDFKGHKQCSSALGPTDEAAAEEAHRNACARVASGVTETVTCNQLPREELSCSIP